MEKKAPTQFKHVSVGLVVAATGFLGLLLLPLTDNFIYDSKAYAYFFATLALAVVFVLQGKVRRSLNVVVTPITVPALLFGAAAAASSLLTNAYPVEHLLGFGGVYLTTVAMIVLGGSLLPKKSSEVFLNALGAVGGLLTLAAVLELVNAGPARLYNQIFGFNLPTNLLFNLTGSSFTALQLILTAIVGIVAFCIVHKRIPKFFVILMPILAIGTAVHLWSLLPGKPAELKLPSLSASWSVALDAVRQPRAALIGVGPASYQNVYNQYKPLWVNQTAVWNIQFAQAANVPLTLLTTLGFFGLIAWIILSLSAAKLLRSPGQDTKVMAVVAIFCIALQLLSPMSVVTFALYGIVLALLTAAHQDQGRVLRFQALSIQLSPADSLDEMTAALRGQHKNVNPFLITGLITLVALGWLGYVVGKTYAASALMFASNKTAQENDVVKTYDLQQRAVQLNPYLDLLRRRFALTNALIAIMQSGQKDLTEDEKAQMGELVKAAVREARSATLLDPGDTQNWVILAQIYQNMITGGEQDNALPWTIQSYVKAIETNPTDPATRVALGSVLLSQKQYEQAAAVFDQAAQVKSDYANAHYNLAVALVQLKQLEAARTEYQRVLALLDESSTDYNQVKSELDNLEREISKNTTSAQKDKETESDQTKAPSLIDQNIENENTVISNPSTTQGAPDIDPDSLQQETDATSGSTSPSPSVTPSPSPAP